MKPLVIASTGRAIAALDALTNASQGDRVEVRRVPLLPAPHSLDGERPTVVLADRTLFESVGEDPSVIARLSEQAAIIAIGV